jgi:hypothetical protein
MGSIIGKWVVFKSQIINPKIIGNEYYEFNGKSELFLTSEQHTYKYFYNTSKRRFGFNLKKDGFVYVKYKVLGDLMVMHPDNGFKTYLIRCK